jgi:protein-L-isoaspartate(D-aspartate) O-methyltransferase
MNLESQRIRLIMELRSAGISDSAVLNAIERVPREIFVPDSFSDQAYENTALPIGMGQTISQPSVVAFMTQALELNDRMKVLEIGTGSGYQAAILAKLARRVYTIERHRGLLREAERRFAELKLRNVVTRLGDGSKGWPEQAPFDRILVTAAATEIPQVLVEQLAIGGVLVAPIGKHGGDQTLIRLRRTEAGTTQEPLWAVRFVPLVHEPG